MPMLNEPSSIAVSLSHQWFQLRLHLNLQLRRQYFQALTGYQIGAYKPNPVQNEKELLLKKQLKLKHQ